MGRPTVITDKVVSLLVTCFHDGLTVREACWQANISHEAYYARLRSDDGFADIMNRAQNATNISAKRVVVRAIGRGDLSAAKWWLERKARNEFGRAVEESGSSDNSVISPAGAQAQLDAHRELLYAHWDRDRKWKESKRV